MENEDMTRKFIFAITFFSFLLANCSGNKKEASSPNVETAEIKLPTVKCKTCVETIETALSAVKGIQSGKVNLDQKTATVSFLPAEVSVRDIDLVISKAGYDADSLKRDSVAYENLPPCCK
jgi:periplasmic mercuric ion binding protein